MYVTDYWVCCSTTDIYIMFTTTLLRFKLSTYSFDLLQMAICTLYGAKCCVSPKRQIKCFYASSTWSHCGQKKTQESTSQRFKRLTRKWLRTLIYGSAYTWTFHSYCESHKKLHLVYIFMITRVLFGANMGQRWKVLLMSYTFHFCFLKRDLYELYMTKNN